jgi:molybdopterin-guanine dinucleotide biosynthesis protein A
MKISALLLAGGRSSRMGKQKALMEVDGIPLWKHQYKKLEGVADEILVSGPEGLLPVPALRDHRPDLGPLAGIERGLEAASHPMLLVLAVDMPRMPLGYLKRLCGLSSPLCGTVPQRHGYFEGLAAVYPRATLTLLRESLASSDRSLQCMIRKAEGMSLIKGLPVNGWENVFFQNWNHPLDLESGESATEQAL